jgi:hypothetical protein
MMMSPTIQIFEPNTVHLYQHFSLRDKLYGFVERREEATGKFNRRQKCKP